MIATWSVPGAAAFLPDDDTLLPANRRWALLADKSTFPPVFLRFPLDPADWPAGFDQQTASLCRHGVSAPWALVPTSADPTAPRLETTNPVALSSWTYLGAASASAPALRAEHIAGNADGSVTLQWTNLGPGTNDTVTMSEALTGEWTPAPGTWPTTETSWTDTPGPARMFYRVEATTQP